MGEEVEETVVELFLLTSSVAEGQAVVYGELEMLLDVSEDGSLSEDGVALFDGLQLDCKDLTVLETDALMQLRRPTLGKCLDDFELSSDYYLAHIIISNDQSSLHYFLERSDYSIERAGTFFFLVLCRFKLLNFDYVKIYSNLSNAIFNCRLNDRNRLINGL